VAALLGLASRKTSWAGWSFLLSEILDSDFFAIDFDGEGSDNFPCMSWLSLSGELGWVVNLAGTALDGNLTTTTVDGNTLTLTVDCYKQE
jgi:hypothetical protein